MRKRALLAALLAGVCASGAFAQFAQLEKDFSKFMLLLGREVLPEIQQNDLAGTGIGLASLGKSRFYFSVTTGAVVSDGILKFIDKDNRDFETLDLYGLVNEAVPESGSVRDLYDESKTLFPYPTIKAALGFRVTDVDLIFSGLFLPGAATATLADGLELGLLNLGIRARKPLVVERGFFPTISLGGGYVYSSVAFKYGIDQFKQDYSGQDLILNGDFSLSTAVHSLGADLGVSKTFLFLTPFLRTSLWYQTASYEASGDLSAKLGTGNPQGLKPSAELTLNDLAVIFSGGLDLNLFLFRLCATGSYNLNTGSTGAELALRFQF